MLQPPRQVDTTLDPTTSDPIAPLRMALRGKYEIERELGQGAFATVYLARDLKHERKVAIKVLHADPTSETGELRFIREIRVLARLQHPNILPLHDSGHVEALLYYVMPYVRGETLRTRIDRQRQLVLEDALCIAQESADALAYAHGQGIVHRDIKPENILLSEKHAVVADFGIARAIDIAGIRQLTRTGVGSPGTPAYMAPEQLLGEREVDARCDIYSLGCVLYEMLTGRAPFAGKDGFVKRFTESPPTPSSIRATLPKGIDDVVLSALARNPDDRFASAGEFATALAFGLARERATPVGTRAIGRPAQAARAVNAPPNPGGRIERHNGVERDNRTATMPADTTPRARWKRAAAIAGALVIAAAVTATVRAGVWRLPFGTITPDSTRIVLIPLSAPNATVGTVAERATDELYDALRSWEDLNLVPDMRVDEAVRDEGHAPNNLREAQSIARRLGAGKMIWGHLTGSGASVRPRVELYDLAHISNAKELTLEPQAGAPEYQRAVLALLGGSKRSARALAADGGTHSYRAWAAYNEAHLALARWALDSAESLFGRALASDPSFVAARLWRAQVSEWRHPQPSALWREDAARAAATARGLGTSDSTLAIALANMGAGNYPAACESYRELTRRDSTDFIGWYGLGECQGLDRLVVSDPASPSHWRFRSSYNSASLAFIRALRAAPEAHALLGIGRLRRLLPTSATSPKTGIGPRGEMFAAYPSLVGDTVAFVPYPIDQFAISGHISIATLNQALSRNANTLYSIASDWVRLAPKSPEAYELLAEVLELRGSLSAGVGATASAMGAVKTAIDFSSDPQQRLRLRARLARLLLKTGNYAGARVVADSLLREASSVDSGAADALLGLAALTGNIHSASALAAVADIVPDSVNGVALSAAVTEPAAALFVTAALGVCGDTVRVLLNRVDQEIESAVPENQRDAARKALLDRSLSLLVPCTNGASALRMSVIDAAFPSLQRAYAGRDLRMVAALEQRIAASRRFLRATDITLDQVFQESWIRAATADTASAITQLDRSLEALATLNPDALREAGACAALGRLMILRSDLAAERGDHATARKWAKAVVELWRSADVLLQPTVARMIAVANSGV